MVHEFVPHARQREVKSEAIVDAAMALIAKEGLEGLTLSRVAKELGLVTTAIYRYFDSKDALLAAMHRRVITLVHERFRAHLARWDERSKRMNDDTRTLAKILATARFYVTLPQTMTDAFRLLSLMLADPRPLVDDASAIAAVPLVAGFIGDASALFEDAERVGAIEPGMHLQRTATFWATLHGLTQLAKLRRIAPESPTPEQVAEQSALTLLRGMGASDASLKRALRALDKLTTEGDPR
jgi:AcrR family transcriptional regulator